MIVHVYSPPGRFIGQVRVRGGRRWQTVTRKLRTPGHALAVTSRRMQLAHHRARVLWVGEDPCYYDPRVVLSVVRA